MKKVAVATLALGAAMRFIAPKIKVPYTIAMLVLGIIVGVGLGHIGNADLHHVVAAGTSISPTLIIFVFLRNVRATIIPGLAIPTSITAAFAVLYVLGFSINNFTLLALILAMGIVVDDAIIVMENAYRHQEDLGEEPEAAAMKGTSEIAFAVIATTVALVAVFTPIIFLEDNLGVIFSELAVTISAAVIFSSVLALSSLATGEASGRDNSYILPSFSLGFWSLSWARSTM